MSARPRFLLPLGLAAASCSLLSVDAFARPLKIMLLGLDNPDVVQCAGGASGGGAGAGGAGAGGAGAGGAGAGAGGAGAGAGGAGSGSAAGPRSGGATARWATSSR